MGSSSDVVATGSGEGATTEGARQSGTDTKPPWLSPGSNAIGARLGLDVIRGSGASRRPRTSWRSRRRPDSPGSRSRWVSRSPPPGTTPSWRSSRTSLAGSAEPSGNRDEPVESLVDEKVDPCVGVGPGVTADLSAASDGHLDLAAQHDLDAFSGCGEHAERRTRGHALTEEGVELVDEDRAGLVDARACPTRDRSPSSWSTAAPLPPDNASRATSPKRATSPSPGTTVSWRSSRRTAGAATVTFRRRATATADASPVLPRSRDVRRDHPRRNPR